jgi:hypothetical protein
VALIVRGELSDALSARASESKNTPSRAPDVGTAAAEVASTTSTPVRSPASKNTAAPRVATAPKPAVQLRAAETEETDSAEEPDVSRAYAGPRFSLGPSQLSLELAGRVSSAVAGRYFFGAALNLRLSFDHFSVGITGSSTLADRAVLQGLTLTLREHGVGVDVLGHVPLSASFRVGLGAAGRWLFYRRNAASGDPGWQPAPAGTATSFAVGPQLELRWQLAQHLGLGIRIGLDVLLRPVSWRYRLDTNPRVPVELEAQNRVASWLSVGVHGSL